MTLDWEDLIYTWSPEGFLLVLGLGLVMGVVITVSNHRILAAHVYWQLAGGLVFFIPLAIFRSIQGFEFWERPLGLLAFWFVYVAGMWASGYTLERWRGD
jgi:hypothetical protein